VLFERRDVGQRRGRQRDDRAKLLRHGDAARQRQLRQGRRAGHLGLRVRGQFLGGQFPGYTVTPATSKGPGNAGCQGMLGGAYPATVTDPTGDSEDTECTFLEFSPAP
jgi:hypothetical protein